MTSHHPPNTALLDQLRAASADNATRMLNLAREQGYAVEDRLGPVVTAIADRFAAAIDGRGCPHLGPSPHPCIGLASRPGYAMCGPCAVIATLPMRGTAEDHTCDGCRRYSRKLTTGSVAVGCISVAFGLCARCAAQEIE